MADLETTYLHAHITKCSLYVFSVTCSLISELLRRTQVHPVLLLSSWFEQDLTEGHHASLKSISLKKLKGLEGSGCVFEQMYICMYS